MPSIRLSGLVCLALVAFAGNSLLCRGALGRGAMDPATFTFVRLSSGALVLTLVARSGGRDSVTSRVALLLGPLSLFAYAALFSWAYVRIPAGIGALVLFAFVQLTMLGWGIRSGTQPRGVQWLGIAVALGGVALLTLPGTSAPDPIGVAMMAGSGMAWGAYSLLGRQVGSPLATTASSFLRAAPLAFAAVFLLAATSADGLRWDAHSLALSVVSGALASGLGYVIWYTALPHLDTTRAAVVQLAVPVLAATGGVMLLGEEPTVKLVASSAAILGGIALTTVRFGPRRHTSGGLTKLDSHVKS